MAFKGNLPSDLWLKYNQEGGKHLMELDMAVALDINEKINKATRENTKSGSGNLRQLNADDASSVIARRNARREARNRNQEGLNNT